MRRPVLTAAFTLSVRPGTCAGEASPDAVMICLPEKLPTYGGRPNRPIQQAEAKISMTNVCHFLKLFHSAIYNIQSLYIFILFIYDIIVIKY